MVADLGRDHHRVDVGGVDEILAAVVDRRVRGGTGYLVTLLGSSIGDGDDLESRVVLEIAKEIGTPIAIADQTDADNRHDSSSICEGVARNPSHRLLVTKEFPDGANHRIDLLRRHTVGEG